MIEIRELASGLEFPEGPVWCANGDVLLVEIHRGTVTKIRPSGEKQIVAKVGAGPNGMAVGPDQALYVCNNGGFTWTVRDGRFLPSHQPADYKGGSIQRVDPRTGEFKTLYRESSTGPLKGPNDIVFDSAGGFWFTDLGKGRERSRDICGIHYARPDGSAISEVIFPVAGGANGIGLSPDESRLYAAETYTGRVYFWELDGRGKILPNRGSPNAGHYLATANDGVALDSLAVDREGNVCVATIGRSGGITVFSPDGRQRFLETGDRLTTNICFGGPELTTAFLTLSGPGKLVSAAWDVPGLKLPFNL